MSSPSMPVKKKTGCTVTKKVRTVGKASKASKDSKASKTQILKDVKSEEEPIEDVPIKNRDENKEALDKDAEEKVFRLKFEPKKVTAKNAAKLEDLLKSNISSCIKNMKSLDADLLGTAEHLLLDFTTDIGLTKNLPRPLSIVLPFCPREGDEIFVATIPPQRKYKDIVAASPELSAVKRILEYPKLENRYRTLASRQQLVKEYDSFLIPDKYLGTVHDTLGKPFLKTRTKAPIPYRCTEYEDHFKQSVLKALNTARLYVAKGVHHSVRFGKSDQNIDELVANAMTIIKAAVPYILETGLKIMIVHVQGSNNTTPFRVLPE